MKTILGIELGHGGEVARVETNNDQLTDVTVVVTVPGAPDRALRTTAAEPGRLERAAGPAADDLRCHGIGIACDEAASKLRELARTKFDDPKAYVAELVSMLEELHQMVKAAYGLRTVAEGDTAA